MLIISFKSSKFQLQFGNSLFCWVHIERRYDIFWPHGLYISLISIFVLIITLWRETWAHEILLKVTLNTITITHSLLITFVIIYMYYHCTTESALLYPKKVTIFKDPNVAKHLYLLHDNCVIVSADKDPINIFFECKTHYIDCLIQKLGIDNSLGNTTYTPTTHTKKESMDNHRSVLCSHGISSKDEELDLPSLYWIPTLHSTLSNSVILLSLPNAPWNIFPNYKHVFYRRSKAGFRVIVKLAIRWVVWIRCGFWRTLKIC